MRRRASFAAIALLPAALAAARTSPAGRIPGGSARLDPLPPAGNRSLPSGLQRAAARGTRFKFYVPPSAASLARAPLMVVLHGAMGGLEPLLYAHRDAADATGVCILAPYSERRTWDALTSGFGPDIAGLNHALAWFLARYPVDETRIALCGFSDGASYALAVGRANGDLFRTVVAYSPGGLLAVAAIGRPGLVITHGRSDVMLPFHSTSEVLVPWLRENGYDVSFEPFDGGHVVHRAVLDRELRRLGGDGE